MAQLRAAYGVFAAPTIADVIRANGGRTAIVSSGTRGCAQMLHPRRREVGDLILHPTLSTDDELRPFVERLGPLPEAGVPDTARNRWLARAAAEIVLPEQRPDLLALLARRPRQEPAPVRLRAPAEPPGDPRRRRPPRYRAGGAGGGGTARRDADRGGVRSRVRQHQRAAGSRAGARGAGGRCPRGDRRRTAARCCSTSIARTIATWRGWPPRCEVCSGRRCAVQRRAGRRSRRRHASRCR